MRDLAGGKDPVNHRVEDANEDGFRSCRESGESLGWENVERADSLISAIRRRPGMYVGDTCSPRGVIVLVGDFEFCRINFACGGRRFGGQPTWVRSWANGVLTALHGSHVTGMKRALARAGLEPSIAMISVILDHPRFDSPTKSKLAVPKVQGVVERALNSLFKEPDRPQKLD